MTEKNDSLKKYRFLVTGGAGFIGSHIVDFLVNNGAAHVRVLDDLSTGNFDNIRDNINANKIEFIEGSIVDYNVCNKACEKVDVVLHQAALGSVPRSIADPIATHRVNSTGFLNMLNASVECNVKRLIFASSSSVYGDSKRLPKVEDEIGMPLSPYAVTKRSNELNASVFQNLYGLEVIGLRYFNIFGPRQSPEGQYAAVIPIFMNHLLNNDVPRINGDGSQTRDFTYVDNAVLANYLAVVAEPEALGKIYNIASDNRISVNELYEFIRKSLGSSIEAIHGAPRKGDVQDSFASIQKAKELLGYQPTVGFEQGLKVTLEWFKKHSEKSLNS